MFWMSLRLFEKSKPSAQNELVLHEDPEGKLHDSTFIEYTSCQYHCSSVNSFFDLVFIKNFNWKDLLTFVYYGVSLSAFDQRKESRSVWTHVSSQENSFTDSLG